MSLPILRLRMQSVNQTGGEIPTVHEARARDGVAARAATCSQTAQAIENVGFRASLYRSSGCKKRLIHRSKKIRSTSMNKPNTDASAMYHQ